MTEEPFRWLEAVANRREYVAGQLKSGSPVFGAGLRDGILLLGVGGGQSKVFEIFDRQALAGFGHPADLEKIRQTLIDAAHLEAFTRAPEDVSLRRLASFGLSPQLKTNFEQIFSAPFLAELLLAELGRVPEQDHFLRLHYDGAFESLHGSVFVAAPTKEAGDLAQQWLGELVRRETSVPEAVDAFLQAWWIAGSGLSFTSGTPPASERRQGWRGAMSGKTVEIGWLDRFSTRPACYRKLSLEDTGLG